MDAGSSGRRAGAGGRSTLGLVGAVRRRLSFSNVTAAVALFVALGGSAYALSAGSVGTKHLKNGAVTTKKLKNQAVGTGKLKQGAVGSGKLKNGAVTTPKLRDGSVTPEKLSEATVAAVGDSAFTGRIAPIPAGPGAVQTLFASVSGRSATSVDIEDVETLAPGVPGIATGLRMRMTAEPTPQTGTRSVALVVDGVATTLNCSVVAPSVTCSSNHEVEVPAGSRIALRVQGVCAPPATCSFNASEALFGFAWRPAP